MTTTYLLTMCGDFGQYLIAECPTPQEACDIYEKWSPNMHRCIGHSIIEVVDNVFIREAHLDHPWQESIQSFKDAELVMTKIPWGPITPCYLTKLTDWRESEYVWFPVMNGEDADLFSSWRDSQKPFTCLEAQFDLSLLRKEDHWVVEERVPHRIKSPAPLRS